MNQEQQVELSIKQAEDIKSLGAALNRLSNNRDFKRIIHNEYFKEEASRLVLLLADPQCQDEAAQKEIHKQINAIGSFRGFLAKVQQQGAMADEAIREGNEVLEEIRAEQFEDMGE